jgi:hypothetical protein
VPAFPTRCTRPSGGAGGIRCRRRPGARGPVARRDDRERSARRGAPAPPARETRAAHRAGERGDPATGEAIFGAIAQGRIDHCVLRPASPPDELFHHAISGLLLDWAEAQRTSPHTVFIVGESWSGRAYQLRKVLGRCAMPHSFHLADSQTAAPSWSKPARTRSCRWSSSRTARCCTTPPTRSWHRRPARRSTPSAWSSTSSSWARARRACRRRCTARPRVSARSLSTRAGWAARPRPRR